MDIIASGVSSSRRDAITSMSMTIKALLKEEPERSRVGVSYVNLMAEVASRLKKTTNLNISNFDFKNAINKI